MKYDLPPVDQLIELAKTNPEELERMRKQHVENLIADAPQHMQRRLRGLQFQIDSRRSLHDNPMGSCVMLSKMMLDSLSKLNSALQGTEAKRPENAKRAGVASVIPFPAAVNN